MEKVYDPLEFGDGISDGPLVGIRYLIKDGADFGVSGSAMLEFFFYPNEHVHTYKYMLLSDASVFGSQSEEAWKEELLGGSEDDGYYTGTDANREYYTSELNQKAMLLAEGGVSDGVYPDRSEMSYPAEPGEVVTFAVLGTNLDRIPGQLNWIALKAPESGTVPVIVDRSSNTGTDTPVGRASLAEYFASVYNSASYKPGGWYGRSSTDNDVQILVYNPAALGQSMEAYFIGYNVLGESGDPDYIQVDIPTELPAAPQSVRAAAGACASCVHELFNYVELPELDPERPLPQILPCLRTETAVELMQPAR